jgi:hypothetical protein
LPLQQRPRHAVHPIYNIRFLVRLQVLSTIVVSLVRILPQRMQIISDPLGKGAVNILKRVDAIHQLLHPLRRAESEGTYAFGDEPPPLVPDDRN